MEDKPRYTKNGMIIVSDDTYKSLVSIVDREQEGSYFESALMDAEFNENPVFQDLVVRMIEAYGEGKFTDGVAAGIGFALN